MERPAWDQRDLRMIFSGSVSVMYKLKVQHDTHVLVRGMRKIYKNIPYYYYMDYLAPR